MKLIGIVGHRGSGRKTYAWMVANTIEYIMKKQPTDTYNNFYQALCQMVKSNEQIATHSTTHVTLDTFSGSIYDLIKIINANLTEIDMSDRKEREEYVVNVGEMEVKNVEEQQPNITANEIIRLLNECPENVRLNDCWLLLDEYIMYIACYVFKRYFGKNFWMQHLLSYETLNSDPMFDNEYRIYIDVKTDEELNYIRQRGGVIVEIKNPNRYVVGGYMSLHSFQPDYLFEPDGDLTANADRVLELTKSIYNHFKQEKVCQEEEQ